MAQIKFFKGSAQSSLPNSIHDGNIYVVPNGGSNQNYTTGDIYIDIDTSTRLKINPATLPEEHTVSEWATLGIQQSILGKIYIYSDRYQTVVNNDVIYTPSIKIGDGSAYIVDLPFYEVVTTDEKTFWNNKVTAFMDPNKQETLVLSKQ